jgi:hypothetical protein
MWSLFCADFGINERGEINKEITKEMNGMYSYFSERRESVFTPRALFIDLDYESILTNYYFMYFCLICFPFKLQ